MCACVLVFVVVPVMCGYIHTVLSVCHPVVVIGRAAQRLQEVLSAQHAEAVAASTIHRLLGYRNSAVAKRAAAEGASGTNSRQPAGGVTADVAGREPAVAGSSSSVLDLDLGGLCEFNRLNPLPRAKFLVDEVSMMDATLAAALFNALG